MTTGYTFTAARWLAVSLLIGVDRESGWAFAEDRGRVLGHGATVVVLSLGMDQQLHVDPSTLRYLEERGIEVHVVETWEAVKIYNELADDVAVGGLFHSTC